MDREEILYRSRQENEGRLDERELAARGIASRTGMMVGAFVCVGLVFAGNLVFHIPEIGLVGWLVYSAMQGAGNLALFQTLHDRRSLIWGIVEVAFAAALFVSLVIKSVV